MQRDAAVARRWRAEGRAGVVARVVDTTGLGPRAAGDLLLIDASGATEGHLVGGTVHAAAVDAARRLAERGAGQLLLDVSIAHDDATAAGLTCGGHATLLLQPLDRIPLLLWDALAAGQPAALATALDASGATLAMTPGSPPEGELASIPIASRVEATARPLLAQTGASRVRLRRDEGDVLVEAWNPTPRVVVLGRGDLPGALERNGALLGWQVLAVADAAGALTAVNGLTTSDALLVIDHDHAAATPVLAAALRAGVGYVGALGSRATQEQRRHHLSMAGVTPAQLGHLHGPAGLDVGARSPAETAVSILAEIIAVRAGRDGMPLRHTHGAIQG